MNTVIQMHIDELDEKILKSLRKLFKNRTISVSDMETNYLFSNESNKNHLLTSIQQTKENKFIQFKTVEDLETSL
ncbi:MAG: hypothetical protein KBA66_19530 [Leptospiraceae bacterium]|nr:hypothetical protein [Leptospiraceae bacterium]